MKRMGISLLIGISSLTGCGGDEIPVAATSNTTFTVTAATELPTCDSATIGHLYYVEADQNFQACKAEGWTVISVKGADGTNGTNGITLSKAVNCSYSFTANGLNAVDYKVFRFSNGSVFSTCSFSKGNLSSADSNFYDTTQNGSTVAACSLVGDLDSNSGFGFWTFELDSTTTPTSVSGEYTDAGSAFNGSALAWTLASDCTVVDF